MHEPARTPVSAIPDELSGPSEARVALRELLRATSDAAFAIDARLRIIHWNQNAERLLGYTAGEVAGHPCCDILQGTLPGGEPLCGPGCVAGSCLSDGRPLAIGSCLGRHADGWWVPLSIGSIVNPRVRRGVSDGSVIGIVLLRGIDGAVVRHHEAPVPRIFAFGRFSIVLGDKALRLERWGRRQALTLLKFLVRECGNEVHRERLMECLWSGVDEERARGRLKVVSYFLRRELKRAGIPEEVIISTGAGYALNRGAVWIDTVHFQQLAKEGTVLQRQDRWESALRRYHDACLLYRGDYLAEDIYADWCAEERERLREVYLDVLTRSAGIYIEHERYAEAIDVCRQALQREPCRESFHRALMICFACSGRHDEALAQYDRCARILSRELGTLPMPQTQRLCKEISARGKLSTQ